MEKKSIIAKYFSIIERETLYSSTGNLKFRLRNLFSGIDFENKSMLDIGGGSGIFSFYGACMGARQVICLEPEDEGSLPHVTKKFYALKNFLGMDQVALAKSAIQHFDPGGVKFDIILLHNSINHLDETACIRLLKDPESKEIYRHILFKISSLAETGSRLIISDCSRHNFFPLLRMKNPLAPCIHWHKHQTPEVWIRMLCEVDFYNPHVKWLSIDHLRSLGQKLFGNKIASYFIGSYFCLTMEKGTPRNEAREKRSEVR